MVKQDPWFFEERASAFAKLVLTKQHAVRPYASTDDTAIDLFVEIHSKDKTRRRFGVQIVPYMDLPGIKDADARILAHLGRNHSEDELPLCVFVIGVRKPEGIYRWIVEPVVEDGQATLRRNTEANWHPLDEEGAARLIGQANAWYDARNGNSVPKPHERRSKTKS
jgi:hypothetical protein